MPIKATSPAHEDRIHGIATEEENTLELSPYTSQICAVHCQSDKIFHIPSAFLRQSPVLASHYDKSLHSTSTIPELRLNDVAFSTGHVVIHFLITGTYQCLKPCQDSDSERNVFEFTTALDAYVAAHSYDLPGLRKLARHEIVNLGSRLDLPTFVDALDNAKLAFDNFPAIGVYAEWRFVSSADPAEHLASKKMLNCIGTPKTLSMALLKAILLLKTSQTLYESELSEKGISKVPLCYIGRNSSGSQLTVGLSDVEQKMRAAEEKSLLEKDRLAAVAAAAATAEAATERINAAREKANMEADCEGKEIESLLCKRTKRGGRLLKGDRMRLAFLEKRASERGEDQTVYAQEALGVAKTGIAHNVDIDVHPVLSPTQEHARAKDHPTTSQIDPASSDLVRTQTCSSDDDRVQYAVVTPPLDYDSC